jgi:hypothetical protein
VSFNLVAVKKTFFDRKAVMDKVSPAKRRFASRFGAFVRTRARSSLRTRKGTSLPGNPPFSHVGTLKKSILFGYDEQTNSVVIGPLRRNDGVQGARILEKGGDTTVPGLRGGRVLHYRARPYMRPAFDIELQNISKMLKGMVK